MNDMYLLHVNVLSKQLLSTQYTIFLSLTFAFSIPCLISVAPLAEHHPNSAFIESFQQGSGGFCNEYKLIMGIPMAMQVV